VEYLLHHLLRTSAEAYPDRIAVVDGGRTITYADLENRSNQLAYQLLDLGVSRGDRIGLYLEKSIDSVVAIYGVLKCGAAYVPFDPQAPVARLGYMARNCDIRLLLTGKEKGSAWNSLIVTAPQLETLVVLNANETHAEIPSGVRAITSEGVDAQPVSAVEPLTIDLDLAYILYTSGSTGNPKGVMLTHLNALTFVGWAVDRFQVRPDDRLSNHAPLHFDLSVFDLFAAAKSGAAVVLVPPRTSIFPIEVARFIEQTSITIWYSVPSVLTMLTLRGNLKRGDFPHLRTILFAGEVFPTKYLRRLMDLLPDAGFFNLYGPTETNVCTYYEVPPLPEDQTEAIPIGRAIENVEVFAVTEEGKPAQSGEVGELCVRGASVMLGYWGDPVRTAKSLSPNPFGGDLHDPMYRTGDLVSRQNDGTYRLLGRRDAQIKSRGYRIELGEIEAALYAHPAIVECAVTAVPDELITNKIRAYVVLRDHVAEDDLKRFCAERIPRYMIPEMWEFRDALPKTSTGKVDRRGLSAEIATSRGGTSG
jgi:amino acid adenylation domain-containing protein